MNIEHTESTLVIIVISDQQLTAW